MGQTKRIFTGIKLPESDEVVNLMEAMQRGLKHDKISWQRPERLHLTLKFFGATPEHRIDALSQCIERATQKSDPFKLKIQKVGMFGASYKPRVLWLGLEESPELLQLKENLFEELKSVGIFPDRQNFVPHITLGRVSRCTDKKHFFKVLDLYKKLEIPAFEADRIILFESYMHENRAHYRELFNYML
jgi:2'-5' RNA ligase